MASDYFSDVEHGLGPRVNQDIPITAWGGIVALIGSYISNGGCGIDFPEECPDGRGPTGTDAMTFGLALQAEIPGLTWPLLSTELPPTLAVLDLLQFCYRHVAKPTHGTYHPFFDHYHLEFDREDGRREFRERAERILARNQLAYELRENGSIMRVAGPVIQETLSMYVFDTGDAKLDEILESARTKFLDPKPAIRREALEKLWDAWERLKSTEPGKDKKESIGALLDKAAAELTLRGFLETEARTLTNIGNTFHIRHSEKQQVELEKDEQADYLFHRLFALISLLLSRC